MRSLLIGTVCLTAALVAGDVFAQVNSITPIENTLQGIVNVLTGTIGTSVAIIGLAIVGIMFIMGRISVLQAAMVVGGIALLFGAPTIVSELQGAL